MPTHDPLTDSQIQLANDIAATPLVMTVDEQQSSTKGKDINFLAEAGFITCEKQHVSQDSSKDTWRWTRTNKPFD